MFDFYKTFAAYSTNDLLKIVAQPSLYQPEAVDAAERLLRERDISDDQQSAALAEVAVTQANEVKPDVVTKAFTAAGAAIRYLFTPSARFDMRRWNYWLCIGLVLFNVFSIANDIRYLVFVAGCDTCSVSPVELISVSSVLYLPVMITLLLLRNRWGWIMLLAYCCFQIIGSVFLLFSYWNNWKDQLLPTAVVSVAFALLLRFLARPRVVIFFNGSKALLKRTIKLAITGGLLFWLWLVFQT